MMTDAKPFTGSILDFATLESCPVMASATGDEHPYDRTNAPVAAAGLVQWYNGRPYIQVFASRVIGWIVKQHTRSIPGVVRSTDTVNFHDNPDGLLLWLADASCADAAREWLALWRPSDEELAWSEWWHQPDEYEHPPEVCLRRHNDGSAEWGYRK